MNINMYLLVDRYKLCAMSDQRTSTLRKVGTFFAFCAVACFVVAEILNPTSTDCQEEENQTQRDPCKLNTILPIFGAIIATFAVGMLTTAAIYFIFDSEIGEVLIQFIGGTLLEGTYGVAVTGEVTLGTGLILGGFIFGYGLGLIPSYCRVCSFSGDTIKTFASTLLGGLISFLAVYVLYYTKYREQIGADNIEQRAKILEALDVAGMLPGSVFLTILALVVGVVVRGELLPILQQKVKSTLSDE